MSGTFFIRQYTFLLTLFRTDWHFIDHFLLMIDFPFIIGFFFSLILLIILFLLFVYDIYERWIQNSRSQMYVGKTGQDD